MNGKIVATAAGAVILFMLLGFSFSASAQQTGKVARIGYVSLIATATSDPGFEALRQRATQD